MLRPLLIAVACTIALTGCGTNFNVKEEPDIEYDPEGDDFFQKNGVPLYEDTPDKVVVATERDIVVDVELTDPVYDEDAKIDLQQWNVYITNDGAQDKCVGIAWRLLDFKFISHEPTDVYVPSHSMKLTGTMVQTTWIVDGVKIAPPASGYVHAMRVRTPVKDSYPGDECLFIDGDDDLIER